jgi:hypothetical protein
VDVDESRPGTEAPPPRGIEPFVGTPLGHRLAGLSADALARIFWSLAGDAGVGLALHRVHVGRRRHGELMPWLSIAAQELDDLVEVLTSTRPRTAGAPLTVSFDDGYLDAVDYVRSRAARRGDVEWLVNVCPEKILHRVGFRWDAYERLGGQRTLAAMRRFVERVGHIDVENQRAELRGLADHSDFALATREMCVELRRMPNVHLGDHSNVHLPAKDLGEDDLRREARRSRSLFEELFGEVEHYALPFGTRGRHWTERERAVLAEEHDTLLWSTEPRPYAPADRTRGAMLPRFSIVGTWTLQQTLGVMITSTLRARLRDAGWVGGLRAAALVRAAFA